MFAESISIGDVVPSNNRRTSGPWTKAGTTVRNAESAADAMFAANLDWTVNEKPIFHYNETRGIYERSPGYKALVRSDNGETLSVMKQNYGVVQNTKAFSFFDPFIESGIATFDSAGSFKKGKVIWVLAKLNRDPLVVGGEDVVDKYILLCNAHDGTISLTAGYTPIRVWCQNTLYYALESDASTLLRARHSSKVLENLDDMQRILESVDKNFDGAAEQYRFLSKKKVVGREDLGNFIATVFKFGDKKAETKDAEERLKLRQEAIVTDIVKLFENGSGSFLQSAKGTYWGAYNAVTEYLTHIAGKNDDSRAFGNWFGEAKRTNKRAFETALEMAVKV